MIRIPERTFVRGDVRIFEPPAEYSSIEEFNRWWPEHRRGGAVMRRRHHNKVVTVGLRSIAAMITNRHPTSQTKGLPVGWDGTQLTRLDWMTGRPYYQALGTSNTAPAAADIQLNRELYRKPISGLSVQDGPLIVASTYFTPSEVFVARTTIETYIDTAQLKLASVAGFRVGDLVQVATTRGFEYHHLNTIDTGTRIVTFSLLDALLAPALAGADVNQCITEAGMFGDEIVHPDTMAGKADFVAGATTVNADTTISWNDYQRGDWIRTHIDADELADPPTPPVAGAWAEISSVTDGNTLVLAENWPATEAAGLKEFAINGTMLNHVNNLKYVKLSTRGIVVENDWSLVG